MGKPIHSLLYMYYISSFLAPVIKTTLQGSGEVSEVWNFAAEIKKHRTMKNVFYIVTVIFLTVIGLTVNAKPRCQGFNNYDNKVTIVFTDNQAKDKYTVSDVKLIPSSWSEKEYPATSVEVTVKKGVATVTFTFPHVTQFSNPQVTLRINGKKSKFKVCQ